MVFSLLNFIGNIPPNWIIIFFSLQIDDLLPSHVQRRCEFTCQNTSTIKKNTEALLVASKKVDLKSNYWQNKVYVYISTKKCVTKQQ